MALRKWHLFWGIIFGLPYWLLINDRHWIWLFISLLALIVGSELADFDHFLPFFKHRDVFLHSALIPIILFCLIVNMQFNATLNDPIYYLVGVAFINSYGIHLYLDLFPTIDPERTAKEKGVASAIGELLGTAVQGVTSVEIVKEMKGSYLIHYHAKIFGRKTMNKHTTRLYLIFNGGICTFLALILYYRFTEFIL